MPQFSHIFPCTKRYLVVSAVTFSPSPRVPRQETFSANSWLNTGISSTAAHLGTSELLANHVLRNKRVKKPDTCSKFDVEQIVSSRRVQAEKSCSSYSFERVHFKIFFLSFFSFSFF